MYYIVVTIFEYRYNCIELNHGWENMGNGSKWDLLDGVNVVYWQGEKCLQKSV